LHVFHAANVMFTYVDINVFYSPLKTDKSPVSVVNGIVHFKMKIMSSFTHPGRYF